MTFPQTPAPFLDKANTIFDFYHTKLETIPSWIAKDPVRKSLYEASIIALMNLEANTSEHDYQLTKLKLRRAILDAEKE